nr:MAG TPA: hypothetical protein [Caudoviricetes sp.]
MIGTSRRAWWVQEHRAFCHITKLRTKRLRGFASVR